MTSTWDGNTPDEPDQQDPPSGTPTPPRGQWQEPPAEQAYGTPPAWSTPAAPERGAPEPAGQTPWGSPSGSPAAGGGYGQPSGGPGYAGQPSNAQPGYPQPGNPQPGNPQPSYSPPGYSQPGYSQGPYSQGPYPQPGYAQGGYPGGGWSNAPAVPMRPRMGLVQAMTAFLQNYFRFDGRAGLSEYWWVMLGNFIVVAVLEVLSFIGGRASDGSSNAFGWLVVVLIWAWAVGTIIPNIALTVRRLHDTNRSGWSYLISLIPLVGGIILLVFTLGGSNLAGARFDGPEQPKTGN